MGTPVRVQANGMAFDAMAWDPEGPEGGALVLALHGFPQRASCWSAVAQRLASAGIRTIAIDQRGYSAGARPVEVAAYAMPHLIADVVEIIGALNSRVHLVGHDWGGVVGWQVAARRPDLLLSWTAVSTPNQLAINEVLSESAAERARFGYIRDFREPDAEQRLVELNWAPFTSLFGDRVPAERVADDLAFFAQPGVLTAALNWYRAMARTDADGLGPVTVPTAYVWGSADMAFSAAAAARTERFVAAPYRFVALDGASHWLPDEAPDTLAEVIAEQVWR
ncbi:MAG TPA: alpha/beta hydrolase [Jatrophihabitans sp.]